MAGKGDYGADELEKLDESDRGIFLKAAARAAGIGVILSVAGALMDDEAVALEQENGGFDTEDEEPMFGDEEVFGQNAPKVVKNMKLNITRSKKGKQLSFSGKGLGKALQAQGLIPKDVKDAALNKASIHISFKW